MGQAQSHEEESTVFCDYIPEELWTHHIFPYASQPSLWQLRSVCKFWNENIPMCITKITSFAWNEDDFFRLRRKCRNLTALRLTRIDPHALFLPSSSLTKVDLRPLRGLNFKHLLTLTTNLTCLKLGSVDESPGDIFAPLKNLEILDLGDCRDVSGNAIQLLTKLRKLYLPFETKITHRSLSHLTNLECVRPSYPGTLFLEPSAIRHLTNLTELNTSGDFREELMNLEKVQTLFVSNSSTPNCSIYFMTALTTLKISKCPRVGDGSLVYLRNLTSLSIHDYCKITDKGMRRIAGSLRKLELIHFNGIGNDGVRTLNNLTYLYLDENTRITDESILSIRPLRKLEIVSHTRCNITKKTLEFINKKVHL